MSILGMRPGVCLVRRHKGFLIHVRCNSTATRIRTPRELYDHLSQYVVGQDQAKKTLSVAVYNHYQRISPRRQAESSTSTSSSPSPGPSPSSGPGGYADTSADFSGPSTSRSSNEAESSNRGRPKASASTSTSTTPSTSRTHSDIFDEYQSRTSYSVDPDIIAIANDDPTITHEITAKTRERDWARGEYFNSKFPPNLLGKAMKKRKSDDSNEPAYGLLSRFDKSYRDRDRRDIEINSPSTSSSFKSPQRTDTDKTSSTSSSSSTSTIKSESKEVRAEIGRDDQQQYDGIRQLRMRLPHMEEVPPRPAFAEQDTADSEKPKESQRGTGNGVELEKSNVLMIGPTGTGKTLMTKTLARILDVPFASCDATTYTSAGYVGEDVENCILRLLQAADYDVAKTENGIIHIDEVDKLARRGAGDGFATWGGGRDVGGEGVQQAFLRLLEGTMVTLSAKPPATSSGGQGPGATTGSASGSGMGSPSGQGMKGDPMGEGWDGMSRGSNSGPKKGVRDGLPGFGSQGGGAKGETFVVDTSNILFICSGAFVGLDTLVNSRIGKGSMGFGATLPTRKPDVISNASTNPTPLKGLATSDLTTYGLIPEFLGRLPIISTLQPLAVVDLVRILTEPKNALMKQYQTIFESYGSELRFTKKALEGIAEEGLRRGGGARGLRGVLEELLGDAMFEVPGSSVRYCLITEAVVKKEEEAIYYSRGQKYIMERKMAEEDGEAVVQEFEETIEEEKMRATG